MKTLQRNFIEDGMEFSTRIEQVLSDLKNRKVEPSSINEAFRLIHSIKSEAAYLGYEKIAGQAHQIETVFEKLRKGGKIKINIRELFSKIRAIRNSIETIPASIPETDELTQKKNIKKIMEETSSGPAIHEFEKQLLTEAQDRGEKLYRLICEIEEDAPLKHPKLYLIINNLEKIANVIAYDPPLNEINNDNSRINIIFSATVPEKEIYNAVNIDQIKKIQLAALEFSTFLKPQGQTSETTESSGVLKVDKNMVDKILSYLDELKIRVHGMNKYAITEDQILPSFRKQIGSLRELTDDMEIILKNIRMVDLAEEFSNYPAFVNEIAENLGKAAVLEVDADNIRVDRQVVDLLADPVRHLLRNAVDHGVEFPEQRKKAGKNEVGNIRLSARQEEGKIIIEVTDDGRGFDRKEIIEKAIEKGIIISEEDAADILSILIEPGFSTKEDITEFSGRGVGLDLVNQKIREFASAEFSCTNWPGEGCTFRIEIPGEFTVLDVLIVRCGERILAIPGRNISGKSDSDRTLFSAQEDGKLLYNNSPVFTIDGRLYDSDSMPDEKIVIEIEHLGKNGCLLADEILFNQQLAEDQLVLIDEGNPYIFAVSLGGRKTEYSYLNPSIIL